MAAWQLSALAGFLQRRVEGVPRQCPASGIPWRPCIRSTVHTAQVPAAQARGGMLIQAQPSCSAAQRSPRLLHVPPWLGSSPHSVRTLSIQGRRHNRQQPHARRHIASNQHQLVTASPADGQHGSCNHNQPPPADDKPLGAKWAARQLQSRDARSCAACEQNRPGSESAPGLQSPP